MPGMAFPTELLPMVVAPLLGPMIPRMWFDGVAFSLRDSMWLVFSL